MLLFYDYRINFEYGFIVKFELFEIMDCVFFDFKELICIWNKLNLYFVLIKWEIWYSWRLVNGLKYR